MAPRPIPTTEQAIAAMEQHGGKFIRALAASWRVADPVNRALIESTWRDRIEHYRAMSHYTAQAEPQQPDAAGVGGERC